MKKDRFFLIAIVVVAIVGCGVKRSQAYYDYKSKVIGSELDGTYTIRAYGRARNSIDAFEQARKQAVYDVIFNGVQASSSNLQDLKPILFDKNAKDRHEDYFNAFFADKGDYEQYVSMKERRLMSSNFARTNTQAVVQVTVCVDRAKLKQRLIQDQILK